MIFGGLKNDSKELGDAESSEVVLHAKDAINKVEFVDFTKGRQHCSVDYYIKKNARLKADSATEDEALRQIQESIPPEMFQKLESIISGNHDFQDSPQLLRDLRRPSFSRK